MVAGAAGRNELAIIPRMPRLVDVVTSADPSVRDLALGTPMPLVPHGRHTLEGVPGEWDILRVG